MYSSELIVCLVGSYVVVGNIFPVDRCLEVVISSGKEICVKIKEVFSKVVEFISHGSLSFLCFLEPSIKQKMIYYLPKGKKK